MTIPKEAKKALEALKGAGFEAYLVGGCVRDLLRGAEPEDWDITTNASPEQISKIFEKSFSENKFGTVTVLTGSKNETLKEIEITPYRTEAKYTDRRHPDKVEWAKKLEDDLSRRDFTINAMAMDEKKDIVDLYGGQSDLEKRVIKTVGDPTERFCEDALRMLRAVRFFASLDFEIEEKTGKAIEKNAGWINAISGERIRDELVKIIISDKASEGIEEMRKLGLLRHVIPEIGEGYEVGQNKHHVYDCYHHSLLSLKYAAKKKFNFSVRLAALLHDVGKPRSKRGEGPDSTFYNHEVIGAKMTVQIMERLKFPKRDIERVARLVRYHLFYYNVGEVTESSVRRLITRVGMENMEDLLEVRMADRIGSGVPKAEPYKLRHLKYIIDKVSQDPLSAKMLKASGSDIMEILGSGPGPRVGMVLDILLSEVIADPEKNKKEILEKRIKELGKSTDGDLQKKAKEARSEREGVEMKRDEMTKKKYWVT